MKQDLRLRATAQAIFEACYPDDEWCLFGFAESERLATPHYRNALQAARQASSLLLDQSEQLQLLQGPPCPPTPTISTGG